MDEKRRKSLRKRTKNMGTWNVQGLSQKLNEVVVELKRMNQDITILTETKKKGQGSENLGYYDHFYSGVPKHKRGQQGVSILIRRSLRKYITTWEAINERFIKMNLNIYGHRITILGVYAVNDDSPIQVKEEFFEQLNDEITNIGHTREIIILGDLNSRTGKKSEDDIIGRYGEDAVNDNGNRLIAICEQHQLRIQNGFYQHREIHKYTWTQSTRNLKSIIDYIITRQKTKLKIQDVRAYRGPTCGSDHYLIQAKIACPGKGQERETKEEISDQSKETEDERYNLHSLDQESVKTLYKKRLDQKLEDITNLDPEQHYKHIQECIHQAAREALGTYQASRKPDKPYWWDEQIETEIEEKRKKYQRYLSTKADHDKIIYKEAQARVRRRICQKKNEKWEQNCSRINTYLGGRRSTESWKLIRSLRQERKKDIISTITPQTWKNYFESLLTEDRIEFKETENETQNIITMGSPIRLTLNEVKLACTSMKNRKASGPGNIPPELLKCGSDKLYKHLTKLFEACLNGADIPKEWKLSYVSTIHKKGSKDDCNNYRGISVTSTISRVYGKIIKNKIENEYKDMDAEEQAGFRAGRSTIDHLFCVTQIMEKKIAFNQELHLLYVDLQKAYDNVPQMKLWESLYKTNISVGLIKAVQKLYDNTEARVKVGRKLTEGFRVTKGLKQGCCLSPTLFKIYLEQVLKTWKRKCRNMGIPLNDNIIYTLCFADDQVVLAQDYEDLEYMTRKLVEEYSKWGLEVNTKKTEYMCIGGLQQDLVLEDGQQIKHTKEYKYLGLQLTRDGTLDEAIRHRNVQARQAISQLNSILWDKNISKNNKKLIYNSIIKSIATYSSEVWQLKERAEKMLMSTEMDFWRRAAGKSRRDRVRNERIREIMGINHTIIEDIRIKQLIWYGHVQRMTGERLPKRVLTWTPQGRRKRGRPRKSWREGIDREIQEKELEEDLWMDRERCRLGIGRRWRTF